eukprot:m.160027 g.160027  ORF g.160027 m.160027 type:complete len:448 (+) comp14544_c0_seq6:62-1405(+)
MVFYFLSGLCFKMKSIVALLTIVSSVSEAARVSDPYRSAYFATGVVRPQTPSMGWRSWNFFACDIDQVSMKSQVDGITKAQQSSPSLLDLGYNHVGLDDCWQSCNGKHGFHNATSGVAQINTTKFPDMAGLVQYGTSKGVTMGFYMNNCRCNEKGMPTHYPQDASLAEHLGWGGIKIDSCGNQRDMAVWAAQFTLDGRNLLVESCGNGPNGTNPKKDTPPMDAFVQQVETTCPFSFFRVSEDAAPQFNSIIYNANRVVPYLGSQPLSRPGCWAYADMLEVGVKLSYEESQSHFALWAIVSSPLILGFDLTNETVLQSVWNIITNEETLNVSQTWYSKGTYPSGRLVRNSSNYFNATIEHGYAGTRVSYEMLPEYQIWSKTLSDSTTAVLVINNAVFDTNIMFSLDELGLPAKVSVRDMWAHTDNGTIEESFSATLASHSGVFLKLTV